MGFGKGGGSQPSPQETAQAQAQANRINQRTPFGSLIFSGPNRSTATTTLSPAVRQIVNQQLAAQEDAASRANRLGNVVGRQSGAPAIPGAVGFSAPPGQLLVNALTRANNRFNALPGVQGTGEIDSAIDTFRGSVGRLGRVQDFNVPNAGEVGSAVDTFRQSLAGLGNVEFNDPTGGQLESALLEFNTDVGGLGDLPEFETTAFDRERIEDALFNRSLRLLNPQFEQQEEALRTRLAAQGLPQGQEAFTDELTRFETGRNQALADLADRAVLLGGQEADRVFGQDLASFGALLEGRGQGFGEALGALGARADITGQEFQQGLSEFGADLARRQNLAGEIQQEFANRLGGQQQQFEQGLGEFGADLAHRQSQFEELQQEFANRLGAQAQGFGQQFDVRGQRAGEALDRLGAETSTQQQRFDQSLARFGVGGQRRQQAIERELLRRQIPLNELQALLGLSQTQQPGFFGPGQVDVIGAQALENQQQQQRAANRNNIFGSLIGAGGTLGAAALLCDRDAKEDLGEVPTYLDGVARLKVHAFRYLPGRADGGRLIHIGPMADDFLETFGLGDGKEIPTVDAFGVCLMAIKELHGRVERLEAA